MTKSKSRNRVFSIFILMFMLIGMLGNMTSVYADDDDIDATNRKLTSVPVSFNVNSSKDVEDAVKKAAEIVKIDATDSGEKADIDGLTTGGTIAYVRSASSSGSKGYLPLFGVSGDTLYVCPSAFKDGNNKEVKRVTEAFMNSIKDSSMPDDQQQALMQEIQDVDKNIASIIIPMLFDATTADLFTAYKWLYPFLSILRVVFGIGAVILILLLMGSTIMDLAYIGLPMWREAQAEKQGGGKHPFGVSYEALRTVEEIEKGMGDSYKNAYVLYFKRRALTYIVLAICLLYLIAGELGGLISWLLSLGSGIV